MTREDAARKYATTIVKGPKEWEQFDSRKFKHFIDGSEWQLKQGLWANIKEIIKRMFSKK